MEDPSQWPDPHLAELDAQLRCPICKEYFHAAVLLPECSHSFCSLCVRRSLSVEGHCPVCRTAVRETNLTRNSVLDALAAAFSASR
ncbi:hypothetical protein THASP1DRAFT_20779 [Thamnocephalis sphaerospora]|uniref:Postreplication repair E3 ubiquitin-protein ligase RAD18 n=1 Tax=Thamnocephalis sphaerospora TaxID=78915 RepID=A0A4P9XHP9_9FUNG|nr:hypothetical protein THASP1DRAFT_20779 [Thamnocephalis sphaerospora]|eukprot:RKP04740.1 hypothetical protein THASP1DRAFT_20779 [Thamnocephalis sphaerospora]